MYQCCVLCSCNVQRPAYVTTFCPYPQLFQLRSRLINYRWMRGGILASQLTEWLAATILHHAQTYMYKYDHQVSRGKTYQSVECRPSCCGWGNWLKEFGVSNCRQVFVIYLHGLCLTVRLYLNVCKRAREHV